MNEQLQKILSLMLDCGDDHSSAQSIARAATTSKGLQREADYHRVMLAWCEANLAKRRGDAA